MLLALEGLNIAFESMLLGCLIAVGMLGTVFEGFVPLSRWIVEDSVERQALFLIYVFYNFYKILSCTISST